MKSQIKNVKAIQLIILSIVEMFLIYTVITKASFYTILLLVFMQIQYIVNTNAWRIKDNLFSNADLVRRIIYFIPYVCAVIFFSPTISSDKFVGAFSISLLFVVLIGTVFLFINLNDIKPFYNKELALFFPPVTIRIACIETFSLLSSAILQELFYKLFVFGVLSSVYGIPLSIVVSAFLFVTDHLIHARTNMFRISDYLSQFCLSVLACILYVYSGSILTAILLHLSVNLPIALSYFYRYFSIANNKI